MSLIRYARTVLFIFILIQFISQTVHSETISITRTVKQPFAGSQSPDDARISAMAKAKREALEEAGTYLESLTIVKKNMVEKDEILALSAGVLKANIVSQKNYADENSFGIIVVAKVNVDTNILERRVERLFKSKDHLEVLKDIKNREYELLNKISELEDRNAKLIKLNTDSEKTQKQSLKLDFKNVSNSLKATDWFERGINYRFALDESAHLKSRKDKMYSDPTKAIECFNNAIRLDPNYSKAYYRRGGAYMDLNKHSNAINNYKKAIELDPKYSGSYNSIGVVYWKKGNYNEAAKWYEQAILVDPNNPAPYANRGNIYMLNGNKEKGCEYLSKGCDLGACGVIDYWRGKGFCKKTIYIEKKEPLPGGVCFITSSITN